MSNAAKNRLSLFILFCTFEAALLVFKHVAPTLHIEPFMWVLLAFAASLGGPAVAYLAIGEWLRFPLTKVTQHSSGAGEDTEPKYEGFLRAPGILLTCPICAGTWVGMALVGLLAIDEATGRFVIYAFSVGGAAALLNRVRELLEASKDLVREQNGYWNRYNKRDIAIGRMHQDGLLQPSDLYEPMGELIEVMEDRV